jgi:hypothetical protein
MAKSESVWAGIANYQLKIFNLQRSEAPPRWFQPGRDFVKAGCLWKGPRLACQVTQGQSRER